MKNLLYKNDLQENHSVEIGKKAPDFELRSSNNKKWRLSDHLGNVVALLFYPKDETLVCTKQLCSVRNHWAEYVESKADIVGISPGTIEEHKDFGEKYNLPLPLLADENREVTQKYGFHWLFPTTFMRTVVIIDAKGIIRTRRVMLRAFRPTDRTVLSAIYAARADALQEKYKSITNKK